MKICIVIQSEAFRSSAGMRIRYDRFRECLQGTGVSLEVAICSDLVASKIFAHDVYIFCKTFDTMALLLARRLRALGKVIGQDLFDDYFSQTDDPRLQRFRDWLRDMAPVTDFAICSTPRMIDVLRPYMPHIPITAVDDPVIGFDPFLVGSRADAKIEQARKDRTLKVAWFGIGDNPFFNIGVADLAKHENAVAVMQRQGWKVQLQIVTNRRAFEGDGAEMLRSIGTGFELVEWTEDEERRVLVDAAIAMLPVNGQSFSRAKSLNRAVTALNAGCQVLSLGYPLYERLGEFVYRSTDELLADIERGRCLVRGDRLNALIARLSEVANPFATAEQFAAQARGALENPGDRKENIVCLLHGRKSNIAFHKAVTAMGGFSVRTIFTEAAWNFPVRFDQRDGELVMRITPALRKRFGVAIDEASGAAAIGDFEFLDVDLTALGIEPLRVVSNRPSMPFHDYPLYDAVFGFVEKCCRAVFGDIDVVISELAPGAPRPRHSKPTKERPDEIAGVLAAA